MDTVIDKQPMSDSRFGEGLADEEIPEAERRAYNLTVESTKTGHQHAIRVEAQDNPFFGADIFLEINRGVPVLHVTNSPGGDNLLHIFFTEDGISIVPEDPEAQALYERADRFYPNADGRSWLFGNEVESPAKAGEAA